MTKKILLGLFILLMGVVSIIAYNFYKNVKQPVSKTSFEAIPQNAALIIKENNFNTLYTKLVTTNIIWEELISNTETTKNVNTKIKYIDSLLTGPFKPLFIDKTILGSLHLSGAHGYDFIFYIPISEDIEEEKLIQKIKNVTRKNPTTRDYDGVIIYTLPTNTKEKISLIIYKNTLAFSYSTVLIEDVIRQLNSENSLLNNPKFSKVISNSGQSEDGNLFVNNKYFSKIVKQYFNKSTKSYSNKFENYTGWTELDITIKPNSISLNGFSFSEETDNHWLTLFKNQKPQGIDMLSVIPFNTAFIFHYGLSDSKSFFENRKLSLKNTNQFFNYQKYLDNQTEKYGIDLEEEFLANIGNEVAFVITESLTNDFSANKFVIFHSTEMDKTKINLSSIATKVNQEPFEIVSFNNYEINKIDLKDVFKNLLGKPFVNLDNHFYTIIDDYVVFGNTESGIKKFITDVINEKVLSKNENFQNFNDNLSSSSNIFVYNNLARSIELYKQYCKEEYPEIIDDKIEVFRKFEAIAFQINTEKNGLYYNNIHLKYNPIYKQETASLWELLLDTTISSSPHTVVNHKTKAKEIFVQDDANKIYLISNIGKVIWTKQLQEPIIGKVHQIDVYKNNKLQFLFSTKSKVYLIDRNGNNVESYPIKLPSDASNGVTPLDYSHTRDYRLIIGCNDNMVYNYDITGAKVKGWEYGATDSPAIGNVWHFTLGGKDYIVIPLANGKIKVIERNGKDRLGLSNKIPVNDNSVYLKVGSELGNTYLITADTLGNITKLFLNDKKEMIQLDAGQRNASFNFFDYNNNNVKDYIFSYGNTVKVIDTDKNEIYKYEFEANITQKPLFFKLPNKSTRLGIVSENQIYLINPQGEIEDGFPLAGSTSFSIGDINNDNTTNLVVAHNKMIYTYNLK
jgi:hypothetical protein